MLHAADLKSVESLRGLRITNNDDSFIHSKLWLVGRNFATNDTEVLKCKKCREKCVRNIKIDFNCKIVLG